MRFETARGSLNEARTAIRVAVAWGHVPMSAIEDVLEAIDALGARVFGLARR